MSQVKFATPTALRNLDVPQRTTPQPMKITAEQLARFKAAIQRLGKSL